MSASNEQLAIVRELNSRRAQLKPDQVQILDELNRRFDIAGRSQQAGADMKALMDAKYPTPEAKDPSLMDDAAGLAKGIFSPLTGLYEAGKAMLTPPDPHNLGDVATRGLMGPLGPIVKGVAQSHMDTASKAYEHAQRGEYLPAAGYALASVVPMVGPAYANNAELLANRETRAEGIGNIIGDTAFGWLMPRVAAKFKTATIVPEFGSGMNAAEKSAVDFGVRNGVAMDARTATGGNSYISAVQKVTDQTLLGSIKAKKQAKLRGEDLHRVGTELADRVDPAAHTPEQAGQGQRAELEGRITGLDRAADVSYAELRKIEKDPANVHEVWVGDHPETGKPIYKEVALPIDVRKTKATLKPMLDEWLQTIPAAQQRVSYGLKALDNIINGDDYVSASTAERNIGFLKAAARGADLPELKSLSQGIAAGVLKEYDAAIREGIGKAKRSQIVPGGPQQLGGSTQAQIAAPAAPRTGVVLTAGTEAPISIPDGKTYNARYAFRELDDLQASHDPQTFQSNPNYALRNDRDYTRVDNQRKVIEWSTEEKFNPSKLVNDADSATIGPPIIDAEGNALGGNGRTMTLGRVYAAGKEGAQQYRAKLEAKAAQFGLDPAEVSRMKQPVLVRVVDDADLPDTIAKQNAITDFNVDEGAKHRPSELAIKDSRRVSQGTLDHIAGKLEESSSDASIGDILDGKSGTEVLDRLMSDGVITTGERSALAEGNVLTKEGRQRISNLLVGRFFEDAKQLDAIPDKVRSRLEGIAGPLSKVENTPFQITDKVRGALQLIERAKAAGAKNLDEFINQGGLFDSKEFNPAEIQFAKHLQNTGVQRLRASARMYAQDAAYANEASLFGDAPKPETSFDNYFGGPVGAGMDGVPPAPLKENLKPREVQEYNEKAAKSLARREPGKPGIEVEHGRIPGMKTFVYRDAKGVPVGYLTVDDAGLGGLPEVYVDPAARRQGIATKLYEAAGKEGHDLGSDLGSRQVTADGAAFLNKKFNLKDPAAGAAPGGDPAAAAAVVERPKAPPPMIKGPRVDGVSAGNEANAALTFGRAATFEKWEVAKVLKPISAEPVQAFRQSTWAHDAGIQQLRAVAKHAPQSLQKIGRAFIDELMRKAEQPNGGFDGGASLHKEWSNLGPETKKLLFKHPELIKDLDDFFMLAKKIGENPNSSNTAAVSFVTGAQGAALITNPISGAASVLGTAMISKMLHSPKGIKLLTNGMKIPLGNKVKAAAAAAAILNFAGKDTAQAEAARQ
jgi:GNAT superfamily N-acetyltransferase